MSRRPTRPKRRPATPSAPAVTANSPAVTASSPCPCGLPAPYGECCGRFHSGPATAPTAELLMRSRYSAFVTRDAGYLLRTWAPETRPGEVDFDPKMRWAGLEIRDTGDGTAFHRSGTVTFVARYTHGGEAGSLHERSRFRRHEGAWVYVDGDFIDEP
ncbi:YchJ family protein [Streptomyces sp. Je 1-79]|uniref:YchJ family protein n=1 Tax=Streptomyces sp. Je 1-79 TaxID=2943847 RepID=UPI0021A5E37C|nr:YchJ family protein [Streptomyces sp. Je 1-79]MCT4353222.1 YchJ family protein [Streptomyces sp. Je 1-79]